MHRLKLGFTLVGFVVQVVASYAQEKPPLRRFGASKTTSQITIDGHVTDLEWSEATVIDLPYEWFPGENVPPPVKTECLVTYDNDHFYVGRISMMSLTQTSRTFFLKRGYARTM